VFLLHALNCSVIECTVVGSTVYMLPCTIWSCDIVPVGIYKASDLCTSSDKFETCWNFSTPKCGENVPLFMMAIFQSQSSMLTERSNLVLINLIKWNLQSSCWSLGFVPSVLLHNRWNTYCHTKTMQMSHVHSLNSQIRIQHSGIARI